MIVNRAEWLPDGTWRDPDCCECGGEGAPCCDPPDTPQPAEFVQHAMLYRAGTVGMTRLGFPDSSPHWWCTCGHWRFGAKPNPRAATGNNLAAAQRSHGAHVAAVAPSR